MYTKKPHNLSLAITKQDVKNYFVHLEIVAFLAISLRFLEDNFLALAGPTFNPPFLPILEKYSEIGDLSLGFSGSRCHGLHLVSRGIEGQKNQNASLPDLD
jgi:hypothetical protein